LGLKIHLGHTGVPCKVPGDFIENFTIVDTSGIHLVDLQCCGCYGSPGASHTRIQLLRAGILPATHIRPATGFTFDVLDSFHLLTLQSKVSAYDYYLHLKHKSDNTGTREIKVSGISICGEVNLAADLTVQYRYKQFLTAVRIWRHLKMVKRAG